MRDEQVLYLDSSALVKLLVVERESRALSMFLGDGPGHVSSSLVRVEVVRAVLPHGLQAVRRARGLIGELDLLDIDDAVLETAAVSVPTTLRSLDAIHLASARSLGDALRAVVTYDHLMAEAACVAGLEVVAPA